MRRYLMAILLVAVLGAVGVVSAAPKPDLVRHMLAGGGGRAVVGDAVLHAAVGQGLAGVHTSGPAELCAGYWCGLGRYEVFLPLVMRG